MPFTRQVEDDGQKVTIAQHRASSLFVVENRFTAISDFLLIETC